MGCIMLTGSQVSVNTWEHTRAQKHVLHVVHAQLEERAERKGVGVKEQVEDGRERGWWWGERFVKQLM